jgi:hypothetical protein
VTPAFDINCQINIDGKLISKDEYYFKRMDRVEPSKRERLKEWLNSTCTLDLRMVHPDQRKEAIISHLRFRASLQKEYNELIRKEYNETR